MSVLELPIVLFTVVVLLSSMIIAKKNGHGRLGPCRKQIFGDYDKDTHQTCETKPFQQCSHFSRKHFFFKKMFQENIFNNAPICQVAIALNTNSAFTGFFTENPFWYQQIDLRQIRILRGRQPIVAFDTADNCRLYVQ